MKAASNHKKHGVFFSDAATVFADSNAITIYDEPHSADEDRFISIGNTRKGLIMKDHYDFSKGVRGKFFRPLGELRIPVYLDPTISQELNEMLKNDSRDLTMIVNDLLRKDIELIRTVHTIQ